MSATQKLSTKQVQCKKDSMLFSVVIQYHSKNKIKTYKSFIFYPLAILLILIIILRHKKKLSCMLMVEQKLAKIDR